MGAMEEQKPWLKQTEQTEAQPWAPHQAHQVCVVSDDPRCAMSPHMSRMHKVSKDKCTPKFIKKRVVTYTRAKRKREEMSNVLVARGKKQPRRTGPSPRSVYTKASLELEKKEQLKF